MEWTALFCSFRYGSLCRPQAGVMGGANKLELIALRSLCQPAA